MKPHLKPSKRPLAVLLIFSCTWGCFSWHAIPPGVLPSPGDPPSRLHDVRIETADDRTWALGDVSVTSDSVFGVRVGTRERVGFARTDIRVIQVHRFDFKTTLVVLGSVYVGIGLAGWLIMCAPAGVNC